MRWNSVGAQHLSEACKIVAAGERRAAKGRGLFVLFQGQELPAKQVAKIAYCLANGMSIDSELKFASGETTLGLFRKNGFAVKRMPPIVGDARGE